MQERATAFPTSRCSTWAISPAGCSNICATIRCRTLTIAGGFAKLTKLAQGALDLHSSRSEVDRDFLAGDRAGRRRRRQRSRRQSRRRTPRRKRWRLPSGRACRLPALVAAARARIRQGRRSATAPVAVNVLIVGRDGESWRRAAMARLLILGGTAEAAELAARLAGDDRLETVTSLAGLTRLPNVGHRTGAARRLRRTGRARRVPEGRALRRARRRDASLRRADRRATPPRRRRMPQTPRVKLRAPAFRADGGTTASCRSRTWRRRRRRCPKGARVFLAAGRRELRHSRRGPISGASSA